ncbi:MAG: hypothetical protein O7E52_00285 [Candidatus Poribacteria bacterium]|nr:hypothetical protein [Candidatus Poribacteria bacterium]
MGTLKEKALLRISKLTDKALANNPFGEGVDKAEVIIPFSDHIEEGT